MKTSRVAKALAALGLLLAGYALRAAAPGTETPIGKPWWPSEWGPDDQRGAANRITPPRVRDASRLIRSGAIYPLGRPYEYGMPLPGKRHFSLTIPGSPTGGPDGANRIVYHDEIFSGEIGQVGTQFDGLGHVGVRVGDDDLFYNGFKRSEFGKAHGLAKLGVENVGVIFARGVLVDAAASKGVDRLKAGQVISDRDLEDALRAQGTAVGEGDVVLIRTGHGTLWMKDNAAFSEGEPGIGMAAARWLASKKVVLVGTDTWATEVVPPEDKARPFEVHQELLVRHGIYNIENLDLEALARDKVHEFAFIFAPLPLKGATGSPGNPIAVR